MIVLQYLGSHDSFIISNSSFLTKQLIICSIVFMFVDYI